MTSPTLHQSADSARCGGLYAREKQSLTTTSQSTRYTAAEDEVKVYFKRQVKAVEDALVLLSEHCTSTRSGTKLLETFL